jgi:hypothetical protein
MCSLHRLRLKKASLYAKKRMQPRTHPAPQLDTWDFNVSIPITLNRHSYHPRSKVQRLRFYQQRHTPSNQAQLTITTTTQTDGCTLSAISIKAGEQGRVLLSGSKNYQMTSKIGSRNRYTSVQLTAYCNAADATTIIRVYDIKTGNKLWAKREPKQTLTIRLYTLGQSNECLRNINLTR